jgi:hypothetical protein
LASKINNPYRFQRSSLANRIVIFFLNILLVVA